jgi:hypothetical protein
MKQQKNPRQIIIPERPEGNYTLRWCKAAMHGTRSKYVSGCRCKKCKKANSVYVWSHKKAQMAAAQAKAKADAGEQ